MHRERIGDLGEGVAGPGPHIGPSQLALPCAGLARVGAGLSGWQTYLLRLPDRLER